MAQKINCPNCGANLDIIGNHDYQFCQYCGTKIPLKTNDGINFNVDARHDLFGFGAKAKAKAHEKEMLYKMSMDEQKYYHDHPEEMKRLLGIAVLALVIMGIVVLVLLSRW